ncbi:hypothetical protein [Bosea minatitlanensis]|uniref:Uncharacterized protein n=1 Tax=Bosea minatitlanensis TaxID=128782 RepID=A0ABW0F2F9_9HYPH|nr:hypothetical protein [Bosea minatitlanensis]MCT4492767.1 hypothetical protein [Bosea minatitlanensis]
MSDVTEAVNDWSLWQSLVEKKGSPKPDSDIAAGFWRLPNGIAGTALPVATWNDDGYWLASINGGDPIDKDCGSEWSEFMARTWPKLVAVEHEAYIAALDKGVWPDGTPLKKDQRGVMGDNAPPEGSVEALLAEAAGHLESARNLVKSGAAKTEEDADIASNLAKTLTETKSKIIAAHKVEKQPWLDGGREVDNKFFPTRDGLEAAAKTIKSRVINPYQIEQDRIRQEEADRQRREAEQAAAAGREAEPPPSEPVKVSSGSRGRTPELADALRLEDQAEGVIEAAVRAVTPARLPPSPPAARQIAHVEAPQDEAEHDPETGEIDQNESASEQKAEEAKPVRQPPKPAETKVTSGRQQTKAKDEPAQAQQEDAYDGQALLAELQAMFDQIDSVEALDAYTGGKGRGLAIYNSLKRSDQEDANHRYQQAKARIQAADAAEEAGEQQDQPEETARDQQQDENDFPGDQPSKLPPAEKKPEKMDAAEIEAHIRGYIETMTDAEALKRRWYMDDEHREVLDDKTRQALRSLWKARMEELRAAEGQG